MQVQKSSVKSCNVAGLGRGGEIMVPVQAIGSVFHEDISITGEIDVGGVGGECVDAEVGGLAKNMCGDGSFLVSFPSAQVGSRGKL